MKKLVKPLQFQQVKIDNKTWVRLKDQFHEESQTIVHCRYVSKFKYINGGWVNIYPTTYLVNGDQRLEMLHADNIPLAPGFHQFRKPGELKLFTLIFPALPKDWKQFNLVEESGTEKGFTVSNIPCNNDGVYEVFLY